MQRPVAFAVTAGIDGDRLIAGNRQLLGGAFPRTARLTPAVEKQDRRALTINIGRESGTVGCGVRMVLDRNSPWIRWIAALSLTGTG
jgi:hypothetical protein